MNLSRRFVPLALGLAAILILGGSIAAAAMIPSLAAQPETAQASPEPDQTSSEKVTGILDRLGAAGITSTTEEFNALAQKYGVGGAVRVLAFAHAAGKTPAQIAAIFDAGKGWGQIRRELGLSIGPGIGWIMGHGHGMPDKARTDNPNEDESSGDGSDDD